MASPEKAVAVPMLKQELDALQDRTHRDLDAIRERSDGSSSLRNGSLD